jgi:hypothetical protein
MPLALVYCKEGRERERERENTHHKFAIANRGTSRKVTGRWKITISA